MQNTIVRFFVFTVKIWRRTSEDISGRKLIQISGQCFRNVFVVWTPGPQIGPQYPVVRNPINAYSYIGLNVDLGFCSFCILTAIVRDN